MKNETKIPTVSDDVKLSVLMPVFNGSRFHLRESIESILNQEFSEFEFIIIDDGSTDDTCSIINYYQKLDDRIRLISNEANKGIVQSLNAGLSVATSGVIARMDCGDVALPERLKEQFNYLLTNRDTVLVSSNVIWVDEAGSIITVTKYPEDDYKIRLRLISKDNVLLHPAVMFRKLDGVAYRDKACAEDYDLWLRLSLLGNLHIIKKPLIRIQLNPSGTTYSKKIMQVKTVDNIHKEFISSLIANKKYSNTSVVMSKTDFLQQKLFSKFTCYAMMIRSRSRVLFVVMKILSGVFCPYYVMALIKAKLLFLISPYKSVTKIYVRCVNRS